MDIRIVIVLMPILMAALWALYNIGKAIVSQFNKMLNDKWVS
nr:photosystem II protein Y [Cyanidiaceae sp.]